MLFSSNSFSSRGHGSSLFITKWVSPKSGWGLRSLASQQEYPFGKAVLSFLSWAFAFGFHLACELLPPDFPLPGSEILLCLPRNRMCLRLRVELSPKSCCWSLVAGDSVVMTTSSRDPGASSASLRSASRSGSS
jgi:hypothetical protein